MFFCQQLTRVSDNDVQDDSGKNYLGLHVVSVEISNNLARSKRIESARTSDVSLDFTL
jgi:hypothetical protein